MCLLGRRYAYASASLCQSLLAFTIGTYDHQRVNSLAACVRLPHLCERFLDMCVVSELQARHGLQAPHPRSAMPGMVEVVIVESVVTVSLWPGTCTAAWKYSTE